MKSFKFTIIFIILIGLHLGPKGNYSDTNINIEAKTDNLPTNSISSIDKIWTYNTSEPFNSMSLSSDGSSIAISNDSYLFYFDKASNNPLWMYDFGGAPTRIDLSADGKYIVAARSDPNIYLFNNTITTPKQPVYSYNIESNCRSIVISEDGNYFAATSGNTNNTLYLFNNSDPSDPVLLWKYNVGSFMAFRGLAISALGETITIVTSAGIIYCFNNSFSNPKTPLWTYDLSNSPGGIDISADGELIAASAGDDGANTGEILLFNDTYSTSKEPIWNYTTQSSMLNTKISADGNYVVASQEIDVTPAINSTVYLLNTTNDKPKTPVWQYVNKRHEPFTGNFNSLSITGDGKYIAAGTGGYTTGYLFCNSPSADKEPLWYEVGTVAEMSLSLDGKYMCINWNEWTGGNEGEIAFYQINYGSSSSSDDDDDDDDDDDNTSTAAIPGPSIFMISSITLITVGLITLYLSKRKRK